MTMSFDDELYTQDGTVDIDDEPANKMKTGKWKACAFILGTQCCERLAFYGMNTNLVNYLQERLGQSAVEASSNVTNWNGTCYAMPLLGAFLADSYLGRYGTISIFSIIYATGMTLLTLSAAVPGLKPSCHNDTCSANKTQTAACFISLYLIALGSGAIKPLVHAFGADQFDDYDESEWKQKSSFFNWFYFSVNFGTTIAWSLLVWIQMNVGWDWGFGIPTVTLATAIVFFFSGSTLYRFQKPGGSPLTRMVKVVVAALRKFRVVVPEDKSKLHQEPDDFTIGIAGNRKLQYTDELTFFDKAAVPTFSDYLKEPPDQWRLCTVTQVEELKALIRLLPIWATGIGFSALVYSQMNTMFVLQGNTMDQHMGPHFQIPSASLSLFNSLTLLFWAPVYDSCIVPLARKVTGHPRGFTQLQRMGIGLLISVFAMAVAAMLEVVRLKIVRENGYYDLEHIPLSIFWQIPQYFLVGCGEVFTFIGQLEFFYHQSPDGMRSVGSALSLTAISIGNYLNTALLNIVTKLTTKNGDLGWVPDNLNRGHLDYYFWVNAILCLINFFVYLWMASRHKYKKTADFSGKITNAESE